MKGFRHRTTKTLKSIIEQSFFQCVDPSHRVEFIWRKLRISKTRKKS